MHPITEIINTVHTCFVVSTGPHPEVTLDCKTLTYKTQTECLSQMQADTDSSVNKHTIQISVSLTMWQGISLTAQKEAGCLLWVFSARALTTGKRGTMLLKWQHGFMTRLGAKSESVPVVPLAGRTSGIARHCSLLMQFGTAVSRSGLQLQS